MTKIYTVGKWSLLPNEEYWAKEYDVTFTDTMFWAAKENGVKVSIRFLGILSALCDFTYIGTTFSINFSAYPVIVLNQKWLQISQTYIEDYSKLTGTKIRISETTLDGNMSESQMLEFLADTQDSDLYECLFNGSAEYWPDGHKAGDHFSRLVRSVKNFSLDDTDTLPPGLESQIERLRHIIQRKE
jgi:hypothetical protein